MNIYKNKRAYVGFRLELVDSTFVELAAHLGIHRNTLNNKLSDEAPTTDKQREIINEYLGLTKEEAEKLWATE